VPNCGLGFVFPSCPPLLFEVHILFFAGNTHWSESAVVSGPLPTASLPFSFYRGLLFGWWLNKTGLPPLRVRLFPVFADKIDFSSPPPPLDVFTSHQKKTLCVSCFGNPVTPCRLLGPCWLSLPLLWLTSQSNRLGPVCYPPVAFSSSY